MKRCVMIGAAAWAACVVSSVRAQEPSAAWSAAEQYVVHRISLGKIADLKRDSSEAGDSVLSATFLEELLAGRIGAIPREGVRIRNARFREAIDLRNVDVERDLWLDTCTFEQTVNFAQAHFRGDLSMDASLYYADVLFSRARADRSIFLRGARFAGNVDFQYSRFDGGVGADSAKFEDSGGDVNFRAIHCGEFVTLNGAEFSGSADFGRAQIDGIFALNGVQFHSPTGTVTFNSMVVRGGAFLRGAEFDGPVNFISAVFAAALELFGARFLSTTANVDFNSLSARDFLLWNTTFAGPTDFSYATFSGLFNAQATHFTDSSHKVLFSHLHVDRGMIFSAAEFASGADFGSSTIGESVEFEGAAFLRSGDSVSFQGMHAGQHVIFRNARFAGPMDCSGMSAGGELHAENAWFGPRGAATFRGMSVGGDVSVGAARFEGEVEFTSASVKGTLAMQSAQFSSSAHPAEFQDVHVDTRLVIDGTVWSTSPDFAFARVGESFEARGVRVLDPRRSFRLHSMKVGENVVLSRDSFPCGVDFSRAEIKGQLRIDSCAFLSQDSTANFSGIRLENLAHLGSSSFAGHVDFMNAEMLALDVNGVTLSSPGAGFTGDNMKIETRASIDVGQCAGRVLLRNSRFQDLEVTSRDASVIAVIDLSGSTVSRKLHAAHLHVQRFALTSAEVSGMTVLDTITVTDSLDLRYLKSQVLVFSGCSIPVQNPNAILIEGLTYDHAEWHTPMKESAVALLDFIEHAAYTADAYSTLEAFFRREGNQEFANNVFIAQQQRERRERMRWFTGEFWKNAILDFLVGFGRKPERSLFASIFFVVIGGLLFRHGKMEPIDKSRPPLPYNPWWFSFDLFLPLIGLHSADVWRPKKDYAVLWFYSRIHRLLGWVLLPLGLATLTGVIK